MDKEYRVCSKGIWDTSIPGIRFNDKGESNYYDIQIKLTEAFPRGKEGAHQWENIVAQVKSVGNSKRYDCLVGVSGGVDSSYLLYLLKVKYGLKPLAVNLDNGWSSDIAVKNIKKVTTKLNVDLETYVINYEEMKDILRAYVRAGIPWIDGPTDRAIKATMYNIARKEGIKFIFRGNDFRSEGKQPREWTYTDSRMLRFIHKKYGEIKKLRTFPDITFFNLIYSGIILKIKDYRPFYFLEYDKENAREFLKKEFDWEYYGGHHHENLFTKFAMSYWLPKKFGIDKRKINLSAQVIDGTLNREDALKMITDDALSEDELEKIKNYVLKKLDITNEEFQEIMNLPPKFYYDYPTYMPYLLSFTKYFMPLVKLIYPRIPMSFFEIEGRK
ncbi:MAG: N-acetyl sugar amidotransferase [Bacteroidetes bacterium]|nr:N-acetyl sugar amidotransferase [Bacteroidota bacterium]